LSEEETHDGSLLPAHDAAVTTERLDNVLLRIEGWGATHAAAAVVGPTGVVAQHGDPDRRYRWASLTKMVTALSVLIAAERGLLAFDEPAGPPGATVRHLLAHASGLPFEGHTSLAQPGSRRIYSNTGFDALGALVADRAGRPFEDVLAEWVLVPLGMTGSSLVDRPSDGLHGTLSDLVAFGRECLRPTLVSAETHATATRVALPGLVGVVPGVGRFDPCDWGLGFEIHDGKTPHWMGDRNSPATFGHFGGAGTFLWVDPEADTALAVLTDREFGRWALAAWPILSDEVLAALGY
jgi:CubicO group peptidase (beta-lactamase class C family)